MPTGYCSTCANGWPDRAHADGCVVKPSLSRAIPNDLEPAVKQWLLNLAASEHHIIDPSGVDVAAETIDKASEINAAYDTWALARFEKSARTLYLIERIEDTDYEQTSGMVVQALDEQQARQVAADDDNVWDYGDYSTPATPVPNPTWLDPRQSKITSLGLSFGPLATTDSVILRDHLTG